MNERVARWLSSLSAKYITLFAPGRRSGDLTQPVLAFFVLSGQQARVDPAPAGEGEVGRGHDRPVLHRPDQQDEGDLGPLPVLHRTGLGASAPARGPRDRRILRDSTGRKTLATAGGGLTRVKGNFLHDPPVEQTSAAGVYFGPVYAPRLLSNPGARSMEVVVKELRHGYYGDLGTGVVGETLDLKVIQDLVRETRSGRPDTSTRSTQEACPSRTRTAPLSRFVPWLFLR